jgi:hypothetical protein
MLIIEDGDKDREESARDIESPKCIASSLPHLSESERQEMMQHYLGFTTWRKVVEAFGLASTLLR